ncbi:DMT family transporter [Roseibium sp. SCPC15]|uniref:DMT family transporter n=1 Tax=Roseibium sp. SCP15 TaxID=3141376 RepID=UPI00333C835E
MQSASAGMQNQVTSGIIMMSVGVACLCVSDAIAKALTADYPPIQILFLRNLIALPFAMLIALKLGGRAALYTHRPAAHLVRGLLWLAAASLFFTSFIYLGLAEATALVFAMPVFVTALSALVLKQPVGWRRWSAVLIGLLGVIVVVRPGFGAFQAASFLPLGTAFFYAMLMISARWVDPRESVWTLMLYLVGAGALLSAFAMPFFWVSPRLEDAWLFLGIALFGTSGITLMTQAFRLAPASVVAPFDYSALLWATLFGWLLWEEIPDAATYAGAAIIIASGTYIVYRERLAAK